MNLEEFKRICLDYAEQRDCQLNPDQEFLSDVLDGIMRKQESTGLRYCPCRLGKGTLSEDWPLLCPCNFEIQDTWKNQGRCWCSLFVKK